MGNILIGYDGSDASRKALDRAVSILKENDDLIIVSVVPTQTLKEFADIDPNISKAKALAAVNSAVADLKKRCVRVTGLVKEGDIAEEILNLSTDLNCDLIVIGHKGLSKVGAFALGSVAEKVVRYAKKPVLVVR